MKILLDTHAFIWWDSDPASLQVLPVELAHVLALESLPAHHRDPFDRLILAQARVEGATVLSGDPKLQDYGIRLIW